MAAACLAVLLTGGCDLSPVAGADDGVAAPPPATEADGEMPGVPDDQPATPGAPSEDTAEPAPSQAEPAPGDAEGDDAADGVAEGDEAAEPAPAAAGAMAAAPYLYLGWGDPPDPTQIMAETGVEWFTMAFMLSDGSCTPAWDGQRPLAGGQDQAAIDAIRGAGGDVIVSFGGWSGTKLGEQCGSAGQLAGAIQQVIDAYDLAAVDLDIEATEYSNPDVQQRMVEALTTVRADNPDLTVYITIGTNQNGPDRSLIDRAAAAGLAIEGWTIMPFNFGAAGQDMGALSVQAAEGLKATLADAYGYSDAEAYAHMGISSMNGVTDNGETVTPDDMVEMRDYAAEHGLARLTFWSLNRDRPCPGGATDACSGIDQQPWEFTGIVAQYAG